MSKARLKITKKRLEVSGDPVKFWLDRISEAGRKGYLSALNLYIAWLREKPGYKNTTPRDLLLKHAESDDDYEGLTLLQKYISSLGKSVSSATKINRDTAVKSFYSHNRLPLPKDPAFKIRKEDSKPIVKPKLTLEKFRDLVKAANLRDKSILLVKWQSMQDSARLAYLGVNCSDSIVAQMREGKHPVRIELPGRKGTEKEYFCYIGRDGIDSLRDYFDKERGWPKPGEPIWWKKTRNSKNAALTNTALMMIWLRLLRRVGLIPRKIPSPKTPKPKGAPRKKMKVGGPQIVRYGLGAHDLRDMARTLLHTYGKERGFDLEAAEFWLGHASNLDKNNYDKFFTDEAYMLKQWSIAEPCLNIISNPLLTATQEEHATEITKLQRLFEAQRNELNELKKRNYIKDLWDRYMDVIKTCFSARSGYPNTPSEDDAAKSKEVLKSLLAEASNFNVTAIEIEDLQRKTLKQCYEEVENYEDMRGRALILDNLAEVAMQLFPKSLVEEHREKYKVLTEPRRLKQK
ncbi:MAG: hypothetical protein V1857_06890 [archaeon]